MKNKKIIVIIKFNSWDNNSTSTERLGEEWIDYRMSIFMKYTLQSLKKQTNQDFNVLVQYDERSEEIISRELLKYETLPENILFITPRNAKGMISQLITGYDYVYIVRLDSDDMYRSTFISQLHDFTPSKETVVILNQNGYIYDSNNHHITKAFRKSPPFHVSIYKVKDYIAGKRHATKGGHTAMINLPHEIFEERNFVIVVHSKNVLTKFNVRKSVNNYDSDDVITDPLKVNSILKNFL